MKVDILTREYPPHVYGGAGVRLMASAPRRTFLLSRMLPMLRAA